MKIPRILAANACLLGAAGVVAAAAAGHGGGDNRLAASAQMLLAHAAGSLALASATERIRLLAPIAALMQAATLLFAADMTVRHLAGQALFPFAAPIGGTGLILVWVAAAAAFWLAPRTGHGPSDWAG